MKLEELFLICFFRDFGKLKQNKKRESKTTFRLRERARQYTHQSNSERIQVNKWIKMTNS